MKTYNGSVMIFNVYYFLSHEVAENQGLITYAFGIDGVDRYVRVYRKENPPCEDELAARRRGEPWNEQIKQQLIEKVCNTSFARVFHNCFISFVRFYAICVSFLYFFLIWGNALCYEQILFERTPVTNIRSNWNLSITSS